MLLLLLAEALQLLQQLFRSLYLLLLGLTRLRLLGLVSRDWLRGLWLFRFRRRDRLVVFFLCGRTHGLICSHCAARRSRSVRTQ